MPSSPEVSIIVPVFNEATQLSPFLDMLGRQADVAIETVIVDGGSSDGTWERGADLFATAPFPCRLVRSQRGRARQLNCGVGLVQGETLLFLHVDCRLPDPLALRRGLDALEKAIAQRGDDAVAGHFALRFDLPPERRSFGYYFYECKARLGREQCIHGDQGFLLRRTFFVRVAPFDESLPLLEDTRMAETIRRQGQWLSLPTEIVTSARRFESEGFYARQLLNALIMNFAAIGWTEFFRLAPDLYRQQDRTRRLRLLPVLQLIRTRLRRLPWRRRLELWYRTGCYVRPQAWQLAFALDMRRNFRRGLPPGTGGSPLLAVFDRYYESLTDHAPGRLAAAALTWFWFYSTYLNRLFREGKAVLSKGLPAAAVDPEGEER